MRKLNILVKFNLLFCLFIILWGAWVRLSGSGAGCGDHWPLCDGEIIPLAPSYQKLIEFTHRLTSGLFGLTILAMVLVRKKINDSIYLHRAIWLCLILTIVEALIGAVLVKKGLVVDNSSVARAIVMGLHLVNTFFLMGALVASDFLFSEHYLRNDKKYDGERKSWPGIIVLILLTGAFGAIAALGDTLFPAASLAEGVKSDFSTSSSFLIRLRIIHPVFALLSCLGIIRLLIAREILTFEAKMLMGVTIIAILFGILNWALLAPVWSVLTHLFLANILWALVIRQFLMTYFIKGEDVK